MLRQGPSSLPMLVLLFVLIFPWAVRYLLLAVGIRDLPPAVVAIYGYLMSIVSMAVSYALGDDRFSWQQGWRWSLSFCRSIWSK